MAMQALKFFSFMFVAAATGVISGCDKSADSPKKTDRLVVWSTESDASSKDALASVEAQFEAKFPGTDLIIETVDWGQISERLINARSDDNYPDISHVQPFMVYSLISKKKLVPFTDVRTDLENRYGPILPAVRGLQEFDGKVYGLAYAVGTTFWSARSDLLPKGVDISTIRTWDDYLKFAKRTASESRSGSTVTLPGGSPFFIDQLFSELVANAGGRMFDENSCPTLQSSEVVATLQFFSDLKSTGALAKDWSSQTYLDQFSELGRAKVFSVPVTYARANRSVAKVFDENPMLDSAKVDDRLLLWIDQPTLSSIGQSIATLDAEPWVIFSAAEKRRQTDGTSNVDMAKEFLHLFYSQDNYIKYTQSVPIHLTPIFERLATSPQYVAATAPFKSWHERTLERLRNGTTRPIMMPDMSETGRRLPFLLEFQRAGILSGAVSDVLSAGKKPAEAAERAQLRATQLVERSGNQIICRSR